MNAPGQGRKPRPTNLKLIAGNPGKRPLNQHEPRPRRKIPPCPSHLDAEAKREWRRMAHDLYDCGLLSMVDRSALAAYCVCWSKWVAAELKLRESGMVLKSPNGYPILNPYLGIINKTLQKMHAFLTEFGMTPASRSRIQAMPIEKEKKKITRYLTGTDD